MMAGLQRSNWEGRCMESCKYFT